MRRTGSVLLAAGFLLAASAFAGDADAQQVRIETTLGNITLKLDHARAPVTVDNFLRYVREGHFNHTVVYRVVPGFVIQAGSYGAEGEAKAVRAPIVLESGNGLKNLRGSVAMARSGEPASATAEFFIDLADNPALDAAPDAAPRTTGYAVFGQVTSGMAVADRIASVPTGGKGPFPGAAPTTPVMIEKATIINAEP